MTSHAASPDPARWARIADLFDAAAALPGAAQARWLAREAGDDPLVLETVRRMLAADRSGADLLGGGVAAAAHLALDGEAPLAPGTRVGAFDVVGELGRGGMGIVYAAVDRHLGRSAALKFLPAGSARAGDAAERLIAEAKAASALDHPNVATVYQIAETDEGRRFIAMARYEGETLRARLARGPMPAGEALRVAREVAAGLAAAHRAGIVHRDVSAANIFLTRDGPVKLLDFGIAAFGGAAAQEGVAAGTLSSMSPEQARGEPSDPRADVWALGSVLYRMLTGEIPFGGDTTARIIARIRGTEPAPRLARHRNVPRRIARIVDRALQKDPLARYPDAGAMLAALEAASAPPRMRRAAVVAVVAAGAALIAGGMGMRRAEPPPTAARPPLLVVSPVRAERADSATIALVEAVVDEATQRLALLGRVQVVRAGSGPAEAGARGYRLHVALNGTRDAPQIETRIRSLDPPAVVWTDARRFEHTHLQPLRQDLVDGVVRALGLTLTARDQAALAGGFPASIAAYREFLAGNQLLRTRTPEHLLAAIERYRAAQAADTMFVGAIARHAYAIALLVDWRWPHPRRSRDDLLRTGALLADRALALDSASAEAWLARAYLMAASDPTRMRGAPEAFRRAIALDPYNGEAHHQYGQTVMQLGRFAEAAMAYRRAVELQPDAAMSLVSLAGLMELEGRRPEAMRYLDSAITVAPDMPYAHAIRALARAYDGDYAGARADAARALAAEGSFRLPALATMAIATHGLGDSLDAVTWLARAEAALVDPVAPTPDEAHLLASAQLALGRHVAAVTTVTRARPRGATLWYLFLHPSFDELRADPVAGPVLADADPRGNRPR